MMPLQRNVEVRFCAGLNEHGISLIALLSHVYERTCK